MHVAARFGLSVLLTCGWAVPILVHAAPASPPPAPPSEGESALPAPDIPALQDKCEKPGRSKTFKITLKQEAEVQDLVEWMMSVSCQKFIWPAKLRTKPINIVAPEPVTMAEAYAAFHAALASAGAAVVPAGDFYRIVEAPEIAKRSFRVYGPGASVPADDRYVTKVWRPDEGRQEITAKLLTELKTESGVVKTVGDIVIVTDTGHRIRTLERLVDELAVAEGPHRKIHLYGVRHAEAETLAEIVRTVFADGLANEATSTTTTTTTPSSKGKNAKKRTAASTKTTTTTTSGSGPSVTVDVRTGTLLVVSTDAEFAAISRLLDELDVDAGEGRESLHVIELSHLDAAEVEGVLNNLATPSSQAKDGKTPRATSVGETISGSVKVTAHPATQSLIVSANALDFAALERVVRRIDRPRRQLYLEVYLLEVRAELRRNLDVGAHVGRQGGGGGVGYASSSPGSANAFTFDPSLLSGLTAGLVGPTIPGSLLGLNEDIPSFGVTLQALETQEDVDIVAQPHLYAAENEEALAEFGETVPVNSGTAVLPDTGGGTFNGISNERITLKLQVTPYVSDDETVALDIVLEDRQLGQQEASNNAYRTLTRSLDLKKVVAHPGQPLVLGGLTREIEGISDGRVPGLGSIPVLGWLFRKRGRRKEKVSLLMVMVPHLIESPADARRIHLRRMRERQEFIERYTAFERRGLDTHVNYRKKSGLLSAVGVAAARQAQDAEHAAAAEAELQRTRISTTIDPIAP